MKYIFFFMVAGSLFGATWTLRPYVISTNRYVFVRDFFVEAFPSEAVISNPRPFYTARDVGRVLRSVGVPNFVIVGQRISVFTQVEQVSLREWYAHMAQRHPRHRFSEVELPEVFDVVSQDVTADGIRLVYRVYLPNTYVERRVFIPSLQQETNVSPVVSNREREAARYRIDLIRGNEGFLTYQTGAISIRIPIKIISRAQSGIILVENKINNRLLRLLQNQVEGL